MRKIDVGGISVQLAVSLNVERVAMSRFGSDPSHAAPAAIVISEVAGSVPDRVPDHADDRISMWFGADTVWMAGDGCFAEVQAGQINLGLRSRVLEADLDLLLQYGLALALPVDRWMMHAAVVAQGDTALVVIGSSGRGKSTMAAAALAAGWDLLTDDLAIVDVAAREVRGVRRGPAVPAEVAANLGVPTNLIEGDARNRRRADVGVLAEGSRTLIGAVVVDHGTHGGGVFEIAPPDRARVLLEGLPAPAVPPVLRRALPVVAALAARPVYRIAHAADPDHRLEAAAAHLTEVMRRHADH